MLMRQAGFVHAKQWLVCAGSCNYPFDENRREAFEEHVAAIMQKAQDGGCSQKENGDAHIQQRAEASRQASQGVPVCVVCRRGNDSQYVVQMLKQSGLRTAVDLTGGLEAWSQHADVVFPEF